MISLVPVLLSRNAWLAPYVTSLTVMCMYTTQKGFSEVKSIDGIRYRCKDCKVAVLSVAAQATMKNSNEYLQFNENTADVGKDKLGVYISAESRLAAFIKRHFMNSVVLDPNLDKGEYCEREKRIPIMITMNEDYKRRLQPFARI